MTTKNEIQKGQIKVNRNELIEILQVSNSALKQIIRKYQLADRLFEKGYLFIDKIKEGRNSYFILKKYSDDKELLNNLIVNIFNTKEEKKFTNYYMYRLVNHNRALSKKLLAEKSNVNRNTVSKWDDKMVEHKILAKDGYFYVVLKLDEKGNNVYTLTDKFEYESYIKNSRFVKKRNEAMMKWKSNEIDEDTFKMIYDGTTLEALANEGKFVYRISKYQIQKDNELGKQIYKLIKSVYKSNDFNYLLDFLPMVE